MTTSNGTRALIRAAEAERVLLAGFVNLSAVCEQLSRETRPVHVLCAGTDGDVTLEDTLLAGAIVDRLIKSVAEQIVFDDGARLAHDCFAVHGSEVLKVLQTSRGGANLSELGYDDDIRRAAEIDRFTLVPELRRDPLRVMVDGADIPNCR